MFGDKSVGLTASARKIETFFLLLDFFPCHQKDIFCKKKRLKIFVGDGGIFFGLNMPTLVVMNFPPINLGSLFYSI